MLLVIGSVAYDDQISIMVYDHVERPVLAAISNQSVPEQTTLTLTATATDPDLPANTLTYSLAAAPAGMTINPATGVITWTPTEAQGPSTNTVTVTATDNGTPALSDSKTLTVR